MDNKIENRFDPPFTYYQHAVSGYVVRPLNWEGIWKDGFKFVGGNIMLSCQDEEDAKMIADTFNRFFDLIEEIKSIKKYLKDEIQVANRDIARIERRVKELTDILEKLNCDYEMYLENIDTSTIEEKKHIID